MTKIVEDLKPLARPIDTFHLDPANANLHPERSIESLKASLAKYGQRKPIVCQMNAKTGYVTVRAGNGTIEAARALGWDEVAAVIIEEDDLSATGYAIVDNRTAEFSQRDPETLASLLGVLLEDERNLIDEALYNESEIAEILRLEEKALEDLSGENAGDETPSTQESRQEPNAKASAPDYSGPAAHPDFKAKILKGDVMDRLAELPENSVDAVFCDPPYGFSFMGKDWDRDVPGPHVWAEVLRVLKPGGYLMAYCGTRTYHNLVTAIERAGFEIRDSLFWFYGTGFPKSHDVGKALEKAGEDHAPWYHYKSALKPGVEPICLAMKPTDLTYHENALKWGVAGLNIPGCRIERETIRVAYSVATSFGGNGPIYGGTDQSKTELKVWENEEGGYPANVIMDKEAGEMLGEQSRFFYCPKSSLAEREAGLESFDSEQVNDGRETSIDNPYQRGDTLRKNIHPTVKPLDLQRYFSTLIKPPEDRDDSHGPTKLLIPFSGSGSEVIGAMLAGWQEVIGIEIDPDYIKIAEARIRHWQHVGKE